MGTPLDLPCLLSVVYHGIETSTMLPSDWKEFLLPPASEGWRNVMFSLCPPLRGVGGYPHPADGRGYPILPVGGYPNPSQWGYPILSHSDIPLPRSDPPLSRNGWVTPSPHPGLEGGSPPPPPPTVRRQSSIANTCCAAAGMRSRRRTFLLYLIFKYIAFVRGLHHPVGRLSNFDWFVNSFTMVAYEKFFSVVPWTQNSDWTKKKYSHRQPL